MQRISLVTLFVSGFIFAPLAIILHESGHCAMLAAIHAAPRLHFAYTAAGRSLSPVETQLVAAAGPFITAAMAIGGLLWLLLRRRLRLNEPADVRDWMATFLALCTIRWLRGTLDIVGRNVSIDEQTLSNGLGLLPSLLPWLLVVPALFLLGCTYYLHSPGHRAFPLLSAITGICAGVAFWLKIVGPRVLP